MTPTESVRWRALYAIMREASYLPVGSRERRTIENAASEALRRYRTDRRIGAP